MEHESPKADPIGPDYIGKILTRSVGPELRQRLAEWINASRAFDAIGAPSIPYISAWDDEEREIWYEFVGSKLPAILECEASETAPRLRQAILERRIYKAHEYEAGVRKESLDSHDLNSKRKGIREEGKNAGWVEAVYKLMTPTGGIVWIKDQAQVASFPDDGLHLSVGCLTIVSKEMEAEEKCEKLIGELKNALEKIHTLNGMLPICSNCKKIRDDKGYWNQIEDYIRTHSEAEFSHSICPDCARQLYPDFYDENMSANEEMSEMRDDILDVIHFLKHQ